MKDKKHKQNIFGTDYIKVKQHVIREGKEYVEDAELEYLAFIGEEGWYMVKSNPVSKCNFSPDFDKMYIKYKVGVIFERLVKDELAPKPTAKEIVEIIENVVKKCKQEERYDQIAIIHYLTSELFDYSDYWKKQIPKRLKELKEARRIDIP